MIPVPPGSRAEKKDVEWAVDRLRHASELLRARGVSIPATGRVDEAVGVLEAFGRASNHPADSQELRRIATATRLVIDLGDIAATLPPQVSKEELEALRQVLRGTLAQELSNGELEHKRTAYSAQSQLMVGALLRAGGLPTAVPPDQSKPNPDYLVEVGSLSYGVEVKRSKNPDSARRALRAGATQLREEGVRGLVIVDVSDCLPSQVMYHTAGTDSDGLTEHMDPLFEALLHRLESSAFSVDDGAHRLGYESLVGIGLFARGIKWSWSSVSRLQVYSQFDGAHYATPPGSLSDWHGRHIAKSIKEGMDELNARVESRK